MLMASNNKWRASMNQNTHTRLNAKTLKRFWAKVNKTGECWEWAASKNSGGYGQFGLNSKMQGAHRISFFLANGHWPAPCCCHSCDNPGCVNPAHLREGTQADNIRDRENKGRGVRLRGTEHWRSKLNEEQVRNIRADPRVQRRIAEEYGVGQDVVSRIKLRKSWKHI